jgi:hypothetical protein
MTSLLSYTTIPLSRFHFAEGFFEAALWIDVYGQY